MAPQTPTQVVITFSDTSTLTLAIPSGLPYSDYVTSIAAKGVWNSLTFYPPGTISKITAT
jgi:hypothetical protein